MRYLHPVTLKETFVASGEYTFYTDGTLQKTVEAWTIHRQPDGEYFVRLDYDDRPHSGVSVLTEILCTPAYEVMRVDTYQMNPPSSAQKSIRISYTRMDGYLQVGCSIDNGERDYQEVELADDVRLRPPSYLFDGFLIPKDPSIHHVSLVALPPVPYELRVEQYRVEQVDDHTIWQYQNEPASLIWLNEHQIPARIRHGNQLSLMLTKYAHQ